MPPCVCRLSYCASTSSSLVRHLDDDRRRLHQCDRALADLEGELVDRLGAHERDDPVRPGLDLDLRHDRVPADIGDEADEPVARRAPYAGLVGCRTRILDGDPGEAGAVDDDPTGRVLRRRQPTRSDPPADRVVARREEVSSLADPKMRHTGVLHAASAVMCDVTNPSPFEWRDPVRAGPGSSWRTK